MIARQEIEGKTGRVVLECCKKIKIPRRGNSKFRGNSRTNSRSKSRPRETRKCHHCGKVGHLIRNCWDLRDKRKKKKDKEYEDSNNDSNAVIEDSDGDRSSEVRERCMKSKIPIHKFPLKVKEKSMKIKGTPIYMELIGEVQTTDCEGGNI
ncbi:hypothetical protein F8388_012857 [Cannabis sativa]|uniref:CCHC-type domain-containing protein n=1 Tax=Cannabis sativa TaxID=3483 RepID=A0A7J6DNJ5_CANSA|nr:hypothetical protein G4B88_021910 [Cannabis sativa]KAF4347410.1 hypothetical protein G4B88_021913 [Cannabis sativa]KAF4361397.1 hypothetical protein F8388_012857 [Cannabis sativa]KAF4371397.1 hypothetical protein G4B88_003867 [Cannabis sativa]